MKPNDNINAFLLFYQSLPDEKKFDFKYHFGKILGISPNRFFYRLKENNFQAHHRALISYHLGVSQSLLFPNYFPEVEPTSEYKEFNEPIYKNLFLEKGDSHIYITALNKIISLKSQKTFHNAQ